MKKFDFMCLGFAKCGTTTLHEILKQHKDIYLPITKEPLYYNDVECYKRGYQWYRHRFYPKKITRKYLGEINPTITLKENAKKVYRDYGADMKLIFLIRNPVERAYSDFKFAERNSYIDTDKRNLCHGKRFDYMISRALKKEDDKIFLLNGPYKNIINIGRYQKKIQEYLKYYGRDNIKFIIFEEFIKQPQQICEELFDFLNIPIPKDINYYLKANEGNRIKRNELFGILYETMLEIRKKVILKTSFLGDKTESIIDNLFHFLYQCFTVEDKDKTKMSVKTREKLQDFYREDKNKLIELTHKDLNTLWFH